jgi:hypothetical protein
MLNNFIEKNTTLVTIGLFLAVFLVINIMKPGFLYKNDGSLREFGIGYKNKTILPLWLLSIVLGILLYTMVLYYVAYI